MARMHRPSISTLVLGLLVMVLAVAGFATVQTPAQIDRKQLREMLTQLGYEVTDLASDPGKEKYQVTLKRSGLDIPVAYEISASENYMWLTVNLGQPPEEGSAKNAALLRQNAKVQPTQFYITASGRLMAGLPVDNRGITNTVLRARTEQIVESVAESEELWGESE